MLLETDLSDDYVVDPFAALDPGSYAVEVSAVEVTSAKAKVVTDKNGNITGRDDGSTMLKWTLSIIDEPYVGRQLAYYWWSADKRFKKDASGAEVLDVDMMRKQNFQLREFLSTIGAPWNAKGLDTDQTIHCKAVVKVKRGSYNGKPSNEIEAILPLVAAGANGATGAQV